MPKPARNTPIKVLPELAENAPRRAAQLNLSVSGYIAILIWNQAQSPVPVEAEPASPQMTRVNLPFSWRKGLRLIIRQQAAASKLSANAFVEALIARDLRAPNTPLTILIRRR